MRRRCVYGVHSPTRAMPAPSSTWASYTATAKACRRTMRRRCRVIGRPCRCSGFRLRESQPLLRRRVPYRPRPYVPPELRTITPDHAHLGFFTVLPGGGLQPNSGAPSNRKSTGNTTSFVPLRRVPRTMFFTPPSRRERRLPCASSRAAARRFGWRDDLARAKPIGAHHQQDRIIAQSSRRRSVHGLQ